MPSNLASNRSQTMTLAGLWIQNLDHTIVPAYKLVRTTIQPK